MAAGQGVTDYIDITDFTTGIHSDYISLAAGNDTEPAPDGAAQITDTWGCFGRPNGGLAPLPRHVATGSIDITGWVDTSLLRVSKVQILATHILSPVYPRVDRDAPHNYSGYPDQLFFITQHIQGPLALVGDLWVTHCYTEKVYSTDPAVNEPAALETNTSGGYVDGGYVDDDMYRFGFGCFDTSRHRHPTPDTFLGRAKVVWCMGNAFAPPEDAGPETLFCYPSLINDDIDTDEVTGIIAFDQAQNRRYQWVIAHQGRLIACSADFDTDLGEILGDGGLMPIGEQLGWTAPNFLAFIWHNQALYVEENPSGFGSWVSMNANELFLVKHRGGGAVIRGDVARPTVVRLPGLPSTHGATNKGAMTEKGYVYGTKDGVWLWAGGTEAHLISPHLTGWFWQPDDHAISTDDLRFGAIVGQFAYSFPFVYAPNNWVCDLRTQGWFRLTKGSAHDEDARDYTQYQVGYGGQVYAFPAYLPVDETTATTWHRYDPDIGRSDWSWRSQPIARTRNRRLAFREICLVAQGKGTITVELFGLDGTTASATFQFDSTDRPLVMREAVKVTTHDVEVRITAEGDNDGVAPTLNRISLGYNQQASV